MRNLRATVGQMCQFVRFTHESWLFTVLTLLRTYEEIPTDLKKIEINTNLLIKNCLDSYVRKKFKTETPYIFIY